jgi:hypothetical protein
MATTYAHTPAALAQLIAHFNEHGTPHQSEDMEPCETILEIPDPTLGDAVGPWAMETWCVSKGHLKPEDYRWLQGGDEVEASEVYSALFQI